ncbi:MAG: hypothetical protein HZB55_07880 [Deltaproteobacteria bacterium]|nr:hypothetical protein [Deltaproteobacteria bacterium]
MICRPWCSVLVGLTVALPLVAGAASASGASARLLTPVDGAVVHTSDVLLVFAHPQGVTVSVRLGKKTVATPSSAVVSGAEEIRHLRLSLPPGQTRVRISDADTERELASFSVTRVRPADGRASAEDTFHTREREATCTGCHDLGPTPGTTDGSLVPSGQFCRSCHPDRDAAPYVHGPAAVYACFSCHEAGYRPARFGQKLRQPASCAGCHTDLMARVLGGKRFVHGPVAAGDCTACHDPHGGKTTTLLRASVAELCRSCHESTERGTWAVGLHGRLPCTRCHDPHGSSAPSLTVDEGNALCVRCHVTSSRDVLGHALFGHPLAGGPDPSMPGRTFGCLSCHPPHGLRDVSKRHIGGDVDAQRTFCMTCHS